MRSNRLVLAAAAGLTACLVPAPTAFAQVNPTPAATTRPEPASSPRDIELIDIEFAGGSLAAFVDALRAAGDKGAEVTNFVLREGSGDILIPAVTLRRVTAESALRAVCSRDLVNVNALPAGGSQIIVLEAVLPTAAQEVDRRRTEAEARRDRIIAAQSGTSVNRTPIPGPSVLRIYSVKEIVTGDVPLQGVMDAVKTALAVQGEEPQPELLFHEDSGVLILRGSDMQHVVVNDLLKTLERDAERARMLADREANMAQVTQERMRGMQAEIEQTQLELELKRAQMVELEAVAKEGLASQEDLRQAMTELKQTELRIRHMQAELEAARQQREAIASGHTGVGREFAPSVEGASRFTPEHPDQVRALIEALVHITRVNPETQIVGFEMQDERIVVRYAGSKEGVEHLAHVCKLIELLDQAD